MMEHSPTSRFSDHPSYRRHRRQVFAQIVLPILLGAVAIVIAPVAVWATVMSGGGDVGRWAAISTMWLLVPVMIGALVVLVAVAALAFLTGRVRRWIPRYSHRLQHLAAGTARGTRRGTEMIRRPILAVRAIGDLARDRFRRLRGGA